MGIAPVGAATSHQLAQQRDIQLALTFQLCRHPAGQAYAGPGAVPAEKWWKKDGAANLLVADSLAEFLTHLVRCALDLPSFSLSCRPCSLSLCAGNSTQQAGVRGVLCQVVPQLSSHVSQGEALPSVARRSCRRPGLV